LGAGVVFLGWGGGGGGGGSTGGWGVGGVKFGGCWGSGGGGGLRRRGVLVVLGSFLCVGYTSPGMPV